MGQKLSTFSTQLSQLITRTKQVFLKRKYEDVYAEDATPDEQNSDDDDDDRHSEPERQQIVAKRRCTSKIGVREPAHCFSLEPIQEEIISSLSDSDCESDTEEPNIQSKSILAEPVKEVNDTEVNSKPDEIAAENAQEEIITENVQEPDVNGTDPNSKPEEEIITTEPNSKSSEPEEILTEPVQEVICADSNSTQDTGPILELISAESKRESNAKKLEKETNDDATHSVSCKSFELIDLTESESDIESGVIILSPDEDVETPATGKCSTTVRELSQSDISEPTIAQPSTCVSAENNTDEEIVTDDSESFDVFNEKSDWNSRDFYERKVIGNGGFSTVYKAKMKKYNDRHVALKYVTKDTLKAWPPDKADCNNSFVEEYTRHRSMFHTNIVRVLGYYKMARNDIMVMEFCEQGDLECYLMNQGFEFNTERSIKYMRQLSDGIKYLHVVAGVIHMDLKLENILISSGDVPKITDFGFAIKLDPGEDLRTEFTKSKCRGGTQWYKPPELLKNQGFDSTVDIWAFGCIAYELLVESHPFFTTEKKSGPYCSRKETPTALDRMFDTTVGVFRHQNKLQELSEDSRTFFKKVLAYERLQRPVATDLDSVVEWML